MPMLTTNAIGYDGGRSRSTLQWRCWSNGGGREARAAANDAPTGVEHGIGYHGYKTTYIGSQRQQLLSGTECSYEIWQQVASY